MQPVNSQNMRDFISCGNVKEVKKALTNGFAPNSNISRFDSADMGSKNISPLVYALGYAALPDMCGYGESPLDLQKAKKIVQILQEHGAPKHDISSAEANDFMDEMEFLSRGMYTGEHPEIIQKMRDLLDTINKTLSVVKNVSPMDMRDFISCGNAEEVKKALKGGFAPDSNISRFDSADMGSKNISPLVYALGYAALPDTSGYGESPLDLQKAKKIVQILQEYGAPKHDISSAEANDFMDEMEFLSQGMYTGEHPEIIEKMQTLLTTINKMLNVEIKSTTFMLGQKSKSSLISILPKDIVDLIAVTHHKVAQ